MYNGNKDIFIFIILVRFIIYGTFYGINCKKNSQNLVSCDWLAYVSIPFVWTSLFSILFLSIVTSSTCVVTWLSLIICSTRLILDLLRYSHLFSYWKSSFKVLPMRFQIALLSSKEFVFSLNFIKYSRIFKDCLLIAIFIVFLRSRVETE